MMKTVKLPGILVAVLAVCLLGATTSQATTLTLAGPALPIHNTGWPATGIQFQALQNVTLVSFVFQNYGANDTIQLLDGSNILLHSLSFTGSGSETSDLISAGWALSGGNTYRLISIDANNSKWNNYTQNSLSNAHLAVNGGVQNGNLYSYWFHFSDLTTDDATTVPEPTTVTLLGIAIAVLAPLSRRRQLR